MVGAVQGVERGAGGDQRGWEKGGAQESDWFQGQYRDEETGLHYNRYRYYDPSSGRFISKDPIGLQGDINVHLFAPNAVEWVDPMGLARLPKADRYHGKNLNMTTPDTTIQNHKISEAAVLERHL
ncbi:RHS repeat-associated protein [Variovorax sp. 1140]|uniref:RHS repeat-associated core domain-containing protein n=1 Tax=Variovorax atrisoli TaxID=3394203 RepID=UPI00347E2FBD